MNRYDRSYEGTYRIKNFNDPSTEAFFERIRNGSIDPYVLNHLLDLAYSKLDIGISPEDLLFSDIRQTTMFNLKDIRAHLIAYAKKNDLINELLSHVIEDLKFDHQILHMPMLEISTRYTREAFNIFSHYYTSREKGLELLMTLVHLLRGRPNN